MNATTLNIFCVEAVSVFPKKFERQKLFFVFVFQTFWEKHEKKFLSFKLFGKNRNSFHTKDVQSCCIHQSPTVFYSFEKQVDFF
jgi:hypothetical protein